MENSGKIGDEIAFQKPTRGCNPENVGLWSHRSDKGQDAMTQLSDAAPEPATWAMFLIGFAGIGFMMRGARRKDALTTA